MAVGSRPSAWATGLEEPWFLPGDTIICHEQLWKSQADRDKLENP